MKPVRLFSLLLLALPFYTSAQKAKPCIQSSGPYAHIVQAGETLQSISKAYSIDSLDLIEWNSLSSPVRLKRCQKILLIPPKTYKERLKAGDIKKPRAPVLSLAASNAFKKQLDSMNQVLEISFHANASGELYYYLSDPLYTRKAWFFPEIHFKNTPAELQSFLALMQDLDLILKKKSLSYQDKQQLRAVIKSMESNKLQPVYANGSKLKAGPKASPLPSSPTGILLEGWKIVDKKNDTIPNTTVYLIQPQAFLKCACEACFSEHIDACEIQQLEGFVVEKQEGHYITAPGPYHLFVTQRAGDIEMVIHYQKWKVRPNDGGKVFKLVVDQ